MNIKEAATLKNNLANDIDKLLRTFTKSTGLSVFSVEAKRLGPVDSLYYTVEVEVKL